MPSTIDDRDAQAKMSEAQPNFAAVWLPYEEGRELARQNRLEEAIPKYEQAMQAGERLRPPEMRRVVESKQSMIV